MKNLKKVIALVAVFAMLVSTVAFAATFDDVAETDSYATAIETLNKLGILTGDDENNDGVMSFRPNDTITRAEITVILARMQGRTGAVAQTNTVFKDVDASHWASGYIQAASSTQIINGYGDGNFGPDDNVLYQDVIKMVMETLGYKNFAAVNGGYPVGYEIAATRQGVLDGVVGGADGMEATRGMVAQIVDNAIEAPLMDRMAYGGNGQFTIYDGDWQPMRSCLSEYLGVTKLRGNVVANEVTNLDGSLSYGASNRDETVTIALTDLYKVVSNDYETPDPNNGFKPAYDFYVGDTNAAEYFGYDVTAYARKTGDLATLISIVPSEGQNASVTFNLDQFSYFERDAIGREALYYMRGENDRNATRLSLDSEETPKVVYNGICGYILDDVFATQDDANPEGKKVYSDSPYSGQVTLIDNNQSAGYDFIFVEVAAGGVVEELSNRGVLSFKNEVGDATHDNRVSRVEFDSATNDSYIKITQNGQPYDYTQLKEWDVLSIVANSEANYYDIEVLNGESTAIVGTVERQEISETSADGQAYRINGVAYDVAQGFYSNSTIRPGSAGTFYVDKYGKIVAYNRDMNATGGTSDNYAYILDATLASATFGGDAPVIQFIYKDGQLNTASFANNVTVYNPTPEFLQGANAANNDYITYKYDDDADQRTTIESIVGKVVTLSASNGTVRSITLPDEGQDSVVDPDQTLATLGTAGKFDYDQETQELRIDNKRIDVTQDTLVFFIGRPGDGFKYHEAANGQPTENCSVTTGANLVTMTGDWAVAYSNGNDAGYADVVVLYNTDIATSPESGVAMVTSVGEASNGVLSVSYYQNGELIDATTSEDFNDATLTVDTKPGSLFKFGKTGDYITSATPYLTFAGDEIRGDVLSGGDNAGVPQIDVLFGGTTDEEVYFGAVVGRNGNRVRIAPMGQGDVLPDFNNIESVSLNNLQANYYVYDASRSTRSRIGLGGIGDIYVDRALAGDEGVSTGTVSIGSSFSEANPVAGMLDYVYIRTYERTGDVVVYQQRQYDYDFN